MQLPYDLQNLIYEYLVPSAIHIHAHGSKIIASACISPQAILENDTGLERKEGLPSGDKPWNYEDTHVWARRLRSSWGVHWKCEEVAGCDHVSTVRRLLRVCKLM